MEKFIDKLTSRIKEYLDNESQFRIKLNTSEISIRQQLILNRLRKGNYTFEEILSYLELESEVQSLDLVLSKRTLQRDLKIIYSVYGVEIKYDRSIGKYRIINDHQSILQQRLLEAVDLYNALSLKERVSDKLIFEQRKPKGTEYLVSILKAIKDKKQITFDYQKYWEAHERQRTIEPRALKEHKQRWYVIGIDVEKKKPRIFGLDRVQNLEVIEGGFMFEKIDVKEMFKHSFGIISPNNDKPINIELTFNSFQAKYLKSLPLHHSQKILEEDKDIVVFELFLVPTYDFKMELMSYGSSLLDIKPEGLKNEIVLEIQNSLKVLNRKL
ncbi:helix-turn-helix transcriptional regulator [Winogradskyella poriferorum]|uniref:helix-turn-helix transcriptional regulator n=1 Tax=Winogradskyella poriferorum TaxID=307627 RepID=UPI003D661F87